MKLYRKIGSLLISAALCAGLLPGVAFASSVTYAGQEEVFVFLDGSEYTVDDMFNNFKNVYPGDTLQQEIAVKNESSEVTVIYMRAVAHDEVENPLEYSEPYEAVDGKDQGQDPESGDLIGGEGERDETVATMSDFLAQLRMTITYQGGVIYEDSPDQTGSLTDYVLLGEFAPGQTKTLMVELSVPITMGNEYMNRVGEVDWQFLVEERQLNIDEDDEELPDTEGGTKPGDSDGPLSQTGDSVPYVAVGGIVVIALVIAVLAFTAMRRRSR